LFFSKNKSFKEELQRPKISRKLGEIAKLKIKARKIKSKIFFKDKSAEEEDSYLN